MCSPKVLVRVTGLRTGLSLGTPVPVESPDVIVIHDKEDPLLESFQAFVSDIGEDVVTTGIFYPPRDMKGDKEFMNNILDGRNLVIRDVVKIHISHRYMFLAKPGREMFMKMIFKWVGDLGVNCVIPLNKFNSKWVWTVGNKDVLSQNIFLR